jgi:ABC-type Fe3+-hydroxamate transport system substrate-binding protein
MNLRQFFRWLILSFSLFLLTVACNQSGNQNLLSGDSHMIQHSMGETCVPNHPQRVVTIFHGTLGTALSLSIKDDRQSLEKILQKPLDQSLKAAQNGHIYYVDTLTWVGSNLLAADAVIDDLYKYLVKTP